MRYLLSAILVFLSISIFACSCNRQSDSPKVTGTWHWVSTDGGFAGLHQTPSSTGNSITLELTSDNKYILYTNNTVASQGTFSIKNVKNITDQQTRPAISFSGQPHGDQVIEILNKDTLKLFQNVYDGVEMLYTRK